MADDVDRTPSESGVDGRAIARRAALFVVVAAIAAVGLSALPGIDEVRDRLTGADPRWLAARGRAARSARCSASSARCGRRSTASIPWRRALVLGFAEQGANVLLPGGRRRRAGVRRVRDAPGRRAGRPRRPAPCGAVPRHERGQILRARPRRARARRSACCPATSSLRGVAAPGCRRRGRDRAGGRLRPAAARAGAVGRPRRALRCGALRRFLHDGVRTTVDLVRHGDRLLVARRDHLLRVRRRGLACVVPGLRRRGAAASASSSSPTRSGTPARCCRRRAASAAPRAA